MDLASPFDQFAKAMMHRGHLEGIRAGDFRPPVSVKLELTNRCNHDCHFCAYRKVVQDRARNERLPVERVLLLVDDLADNGVQGLMFTGGGEPLMHPDISRIFARCRARGLEHALITNGALLHRLSDDDLAGLTWVRFSVNAGSPATYAVVHGVTERQWHTVWQQVARAADRARFPGLTVGVSMVVTPDNHETMELAALAAKHAGADYLHLRPAFSGPHTELARQLDPATIQRCLGRLVALRALSTPRFRVHGISRRFHEIESPPRDLIHCTATPLVAYVLPTGDVSICTLVREDDFNPAVPDPFLGNIADERFFDLWNSPRHHALIRGLSRSGCDRCHFAEYNRALAALDADAMHQSFL